MACGSNSGQTSGNQQTLEQEEALAEANINEAAVAAHEQYLSQVLPGTSPLHIPRNAKITEQEKDGYSQVKYQWSRGDYNYTSRWHTRTPGAPSDQGATWVVERHRPGIGYGPNARPAIREVLVGKNKWVPLSTWKAAIRARRTGSTTQKQKEMLDNGHWKA